MKMLRPILLGLAAIMSVMPAAAQFQANQPLPLDPKVKVGKLPNGLTYYIQKNALPAKKVQLRLVINAGSVLETPDQQGLAHFYGTYEFQWFQAFS